MPKGYSFLNNAGKLHCTLLNRIVQGHVVIDREEILDDRGKFFGVAILVRVKIVQVGLRHFRYELRQS